MSQPNDRLTTGWKILIILAFLGVLLGGGNAERNARAARHEVQRLRNEVRHLDSKVSKLEQEQRQRRLAEDASPGSPGD